MKNLNQAVQQVDLRKPLAGESAPVTRIPAEAAAIVNGLFKELQAIFPAWRHAFPSDIELAQAKKTWAKSFLENKILNQSQLQIGLRKARACCSPHFPSVGQFVEWATPTPADLGLPDVRAAYLEACRGSHDVRGFEWSHPAVSAAGRDVGWFVLRTFPEAKSGPMFKRSYEIVCKRVMAGEDLDAQIPKALPSPLSREFRKSSPEVGKRHLASFKALLRAR